MKLGSGIEVTLEVKLIWMILKMQVPIHCSMLKGTMFLTSWAQLLIFSSGYYIIQIIVDISSRKLFIRRYDTENDRWQEWGNIIIT